MRKLLCSLAFAASLAAAASSAHAQTLFTGSGCSGNTFLFCASWTGTYVDATHVNLFITNTSNAGPANNANSAFTQIAIGNVTVADPTSMTPVVGWSFETSVNGFNGFGLLENQFGSITTNGINNALTGGASLNFAFAFGGSIGTFAQAQTAFAGAQIAVHDQGTPPRTQCASSKGVLVGNATGTQGSAPCGLGTSTVPEPGTYALLATGLVGIFGIARRRRTA